MKQVKRIIKIILVLVIIAGIGVTSLYYWGTYSEGVRSGQIIKISKKGTIFKTYEGQLKLTGFGAVKDANQFSEIWEYSVDKDNKELIDKMEQLSLSGNRVELRYIQRYGVIPWRGNTAYFITDIKSESSDNMDEDRPIM